MTRTSPRNPKCNGMLERHMRTIVCMVRAYLRGEQRNWDLYLSFLASAYRSTPNESTGFTPNFLMLGREVRSPVEVMLGTHKTIESISYGGYVTIIRNKMCKAHEVCRNHLSLAAKRRKTRYDVKQNLKRYQPGDAVWLRNEKRLEGVCPKLQPAFEGPFVVV